MINKNRLLFVSLGVGIGIILANMIHILNPSVEYIEHSDEEIISAARELGMVSIKESVATKPEEKELKKPESIEVKVTVAAGDTLEEISRRLYEADLIDSEKNFNQYVRARGLDKKLRAGTYQISQNLDYETMTMILMKKQD